MPNEDEITREAPQTTRHSWLVRIKKFLFKKNQSQPVIMSALQTDDIENTIPIEHDKQKIWKKQVGAILMHDTSERLLVVNHIDDDKANHTPSNLG